MVPDARVAEYEAVVSSVTEWAESQADIFAVGVVGSWARGNQHSDSDVDLVVLTPDNAAYTSTDGWIKAAIGIPAPVVRRKEWRALTERRLRLASGLEIEFGFVEPSWARIDPIDPGTAEVVIDGGLLPVYDPEGLLGLLAATAS